MKTSDVATNVALQIQCHLHHHHHQLHGLDPVIPFRLLSLVQQSLQCIAKLAYIFDSRPFVLEMLQSIIPVVLYVYVYVKNL